MKKYPDTLLYNFTHLYIEGRNNTIDPHAHIQWNNHLSIRRCYMHAYLTFFWNVLDEIHMSMWVPLHILTCICNMCTRVCHVSVCVSWTLSTAGRLLEINTTVITHFIYYQMCNCMNIYSNCMIKWILRLAPRCCEHLSSIGGETSALLSVIVHQPRLNSSVQPPLW